MAFVASLFGTSFGNPDDPMILLKSIVQPSSLTRTEILEDASHPLHRSLVDGPFLPFHFRLKGFQVGEHGLGKQQPQVPRFRYPSTG